jgi:hypothetical protein
MGEEREREGEKNRDGQGRNGGERDAISRIRVWCETYYALD